MYGVGTSPFGEALVAWGREGITHLSLHDVVTPDDVTSAELAALTRDDRMASEWIGRAFRTTAPGNRCPIHPTGTPFQQRVWDALRAIPAGETHTYGAIAAHIGAPRAARAVGAAVGANPIAWLIPCHRVLPATGGIGGFRWGPERKRAMLTAEGGRETR